MNQIIEFTLAILGLLVTNGICFYSITRNLKKAEVEEKQLENLKRQDDEWQELYYEAKNKLSIKDDIITQLRQENDTLKKTNGLLELKNQQLNWYRCNVENCHNRRPPHVFNVDGIELSSNDKN